MCIYYTNRTVAHANGQGLFFITVVVKEKKGIVDQNADEALRLSIDGLGKIIGVGNANLKDTDPYFGDTHRLWKGRALIIIRSTHAPLLSG